MEPAVNGTKNVIMAAAEAKVRRVVFTSSIGTVYMDPNRSPDVVVDESCWSDLEYCKNTKNWYCYGKTVAEQDAWDVARNKGVDLVVVNPVVVVGPLLQPTVNASILHILKCSDEEKPKKTKLQAHKPEDQGSGHRIRPVKQCLYETVKSLQEKGILPIPKHVEDSVNIQYKSSFISRV
ncbi:hypothetical protein D5086_000396 [Populus alba]|uniref:Uncharacterized protein n=1 Tax=Populus alba TaxID=43335 RepID=A0ACC4CVQ7_POPAL